MKRKEQKRREVTKPQNKLEYIVMISEMERFKSGGI